MLGFVLFLAFLVLVVGLVWLWLRNSKTARADVGTVVKDLRTGASKDVAQARQAAGAAVTGTQPKTPAPPAPKA